MYHVRILPYIYIYIYGKTRFIYFIFWSYFCSCSLFLLITCWISEYDTFIVLSNKPVFVCLQDDEPVECPQCNIAMKRGYYYHKGCSRRSDVYEDRVMMCPRAAPAVVLTCPTCLREYSRWCDQDKEKKKKAGCEIHQKELCYWTQSWKSDKWVLICNICRMSLNNKKKLPGAKRGRCSHCGVS